LGKIASIIFILIKFKSILADQVYILTGY